MLTKIFQTTFLFCFLHLILLTPLVAQTRQIKGKVTDGVTGEPLFGATVRIDETTDGQITDINGNYSLSMSGENVVLVFSFMGYNEEKISVNGRNEINIALMPGIAMLTEMVVTAQAIGQRKAINEQLSSTTISNMVSGDRIRDVPDANAAESIGRLPGVSVKRSSGEGDQIVVRGVQPRLNLITVNGIRMPSTSETNSAVGLAGISQYMLDGIEVRKSLTAMDDADVVGGIVDLKLATAPEKYHINALVEGMYTDLTKNFGSYRASLQGSNRFFKNKIGIIAQVNSEKADRTRERFSAGFGRDARVSVNEGVFLGNGSFQLHEILRDRLSANALIDFRLPGGKIQLISIYNKFDEDRWERDFNYQVKPEAVLSRTHRSIVSNSSSFINSLNLETGLFNFAKFDLGASITRGIRKDPSNKYLIFRYNENIDSPINPEFLQDTYGKTGYDVIDHFRDNSDNYNIFGLGHDRVYFEENETTLQSNLEIPFGNVSSFSGMVKIGGKMRFKDRNYDLEGDGRSTIHGADDPMRTAILEENPDFNWPFDAANRPGLAPIPAYPVYNNNWSREILEDRILLENFAGRDAVNSIINNLAAANWANLNHWLINSNDAVNDYNGEEQFYAGYLMTDLKWKDWFSLNAGLRYEDEKTTYAGYGLVANANQFNYADTLDASTRRNSYFLPSANMKIRYLKWADVRLAYSQSLARPEYYSFIPRYKADLRVSMSEPAGNVDLKPARSENFDLIFSFYSNYIGLLTLGGFYKEISDFYYVRSFKVIDPEEDNLIHGYEALNVPKSQYIQVWFNSPEKASLRGIEFDFQTSFWYLPQPFNGLVLNANYAVMKSRSTYYVSEVVKEYYGTRPWEFNENRVDSFFTRRMIDQPDNTFNISLGYDYKGFSLRVAYNYQGDALVFKGDKEENDGFTQSYERWDLSMRQQLPLKGLSMQILVNNITSIPDRQYRWRNTFLTFEEYYGTTASIGLKYSF